MDRADRLGAETQGAGEPAEGAGVGAGGEGGEGGWGAEVAVDGSERTGRGVAAFRTAAWSAAVAAGLAWAGGWAAALATAAAIWASSTSCL